MCEKYTLITEQDMKNIIWGATLMGGGGGGSITSGTMLMEKFKESHTGSDMTVKLYEPEHMADGSYASATAGMGAPAAIVGVDFSKYAANASALLKEIAERAGKKLMYNIPVELGGFSTFFPFLLSLQSKEEGVEMPVVDADGAGRAVPALETLLLNVNGCVTSPLALANDKNDKISVELADPYNAPLAEKIGRDICSEFGNMVGISGWLVSKEDVRTKICTGTITLCKKIGEVLRTSNALDSDMFEELARQQLVDTKVICKGTITDITTETHGGFDYGTLTVQSDRYPDHVYCIRFQNENLLLQKKLGENEFEYLMTVPDLTCMYCIDPAGAEGVIPRMPLSNADAKKGMKIAVGVIKVDPKWFMTEEKWWNVWNECMETIGYTCGYLGFDHVEPQE